MNIYLIERKDQESLLHDHAYGYVVVAKSPAEARRFAYKEHEDSVWTNTEMSTVKKIGVAGGVKAGVVLEDFLAG